MTEQEETREDYTLTLLVPISVKGALQKEQARRVLAGTKKARITTIAAEWLTKMSEQGATVETE